MSILSRRSTNGRPCMKGSNRFLATSCFESEMKVYRKWSDNWRGEPLLGCTSQCPLLADSGLSGFENVWHCLSDRMSTNTVYKLCTRKWWLSHIISQAVIFNCRMISSFVWGISIIFQPSPLFPCPVKNEIDRHFLFAVVFLPGSGMLPGKFVGKIWWGRIAVPTALLNLYF